MYCFCVWGVAVVGSGRVILSFYTCVLLTDCLLVYWCGFLFAFRLILGFGLFGEFASLYWWLIMIWVCFIVVTECCVGSLF